MTTFFNSRIRFVPTNQLPFEQASQADFNLFRCLCKRKNGSDLQFGIKVQVLHIKHMNHYIVYILCPVLEKKKKKIFQGKVTSQIWLDQHYQEKQGMSPIHYASQCINIYTTHANKPCNTSLITRWHHFKWARLNEPYEYCIHFEYSI